MKKSLLLVVTGIVFSALLLTNIPVSAYSFDLTNNDDPQLDLDILENMLSGNMKNLGPDWYHKPVNYAELVSWYQNLESVYPDYMEVFKAKSGFNQKILLQKIDLVDQVIKKAKQKLAGADKRDYEKLLGKILKSINISKALYQIGTKENSIDDKMLKSVAADMNLEESKKEVDFEKGLKIIDGKAEYRVSAETFIEADLDDLKMDTAFFLFGKEQ